jgi:hypothetical protein
LTDDETQITEISFLPDGRVCVFGMSREVLELLGDLALGDPQLARRYERLSQLSEPAPVSSARAAIQLGGEGEAP